MTDPSERDEHAEAYAEEIEALIDEDPEAALAFAAEVPPELRDHLDIRLVTAVAHCAHHGPERALGLFKRLAADYPKHGDVRHALGRTHELLDDSAAMITEYLAVLDLDIEQDRELGFSLAEVSPPILETAREVIEALPEEFRTRLAKVPVLIEERPARHLVEQGFDPRSVGLFEGPDHAEPLWESPTTVPQIVIYAANLLANLDPEDPDALAREVEITVLHEVGHYFGLDEERLAELGLD